VVNQIGSSGGRAVAVRSDVSSVLGIEAFYEAVDTVLRSQTGQDRFDILVNNAGIIDTATIAQTSEKVFDRLFNLNTKGAFFAIQQAIPRLRDGGRIINLSSGLTRFSYPQYIAYAATKGAIEVITRVLAHELGSITFGSWLMVVFNSFFMQPLPQMMVRRSPLMLKEWRSIDKELAIVK
jgi:NAD(P)-dependent dehydrogenase (short-subunit alcohol dehydrogenase family)